ncbi:MAG: hypothetical protein WCP28_05950 [Actinomycetes bacterium]
MQWPVPGRAGIAQEITTVASIEADDGSLTGSWTAGLPLTDSNGSVPQSRSMRIGALVATVVVGVGLAGTPQVSATAAVPHHPVPWCGLGASPRPNSRPLWLTAAARTQSPVHPVAGHPD